MGSNKLSKNLEPIVPGCILLVKLQQLHLQQQKSFDLL